MLLRLARYLLALLSKILPASWRRRLALMRYRAVGKQQLVAATDPQTAQAETLREIMHAHRRTEIGQSHAFARCDTMAEFRRRVPLRHYEQLAPLIDRQARGESGVVLATPTEGRAISEPDGSYACFASEAVERAVAQVDQLTWRLVHDTLPTQGRWLDILPYRPPGRQSIYHLGTTIDNCVPSEVFTIANTGVRYYLILRIALMHEVQIIRACTPGTLRVLAQQLSTQWDELVEDIASGSYRHRERLDQNVIDALPVVKPAPAHATQLSNRGSDPASAWPQLSALLCHIDGPARSAAERLPDLFGDIRLINAGARHAAGCLTLAHHGEGGPIALHNQLVEFVPADANDPLATIPIGVDQLQAGSRYLPVITGHNGLLRCAIDRVIEVTGWTQSLPIGSVTERYMTPLWVDCDPAVSIDAEDVRLAVKHAAEQLDLLVAEFTAWVVPAEDAEPTEKQAASFWQRLFQRKTPETEPEPARIAIAIEFSGALDDGLVGKLAAELEAGLQGVTNYPEARKAKQLGAASVVVLRSGTLSAARTTRMERGEPWAHDPAPALRQAPPAFDDQAISATSAGT